ncbi:glycosyltransferase [Ruficoccus amylovorans]|uniref:Glycosyltransferase n=1 Tax=Ruficoccus amylovorans TaxID=1804625 RepID=A0A842HGR6_9BACT|nr:glycosyltransferase [Ruficoccus amylovorans]MBC2595612.1 glycosyltransferase [Ruficoccus amylovorans]
MSQPSPCFLNPESFPKLGGPYKSVRLFQKALGGTVVSPTSDREETMQTADQCNTKYIYTSQQHWLHGETKRNLEHLLSQASLVSCHQIFRGHNIVCRDIARRHKIPYWAVPHGSMDPWVFTYGRLQKQLWYNIFGKNYFKEARFIILATEREREKMSQRYNGDNMRVVYWPVEPLDITNREAHRQNFRQQLGIPPESRVLLYFGRYHSMKRPMETLHAFAQARLSENTHLVMAGIDYDVSQQQLLNHKESQQIRNAHILGPVYEEQKLRLLFGSDVYISLSIRENFNHTAAESMTAGLALILSPGNDLQYSFPQGNDFGWNLPSDSQETIIESLRMLDKSPIEKIHKKGEAARQWALDTLSVERFQEKLRSLYQQSLA